MDEDVMNVAGPGYLIHREPNCRFVEAWTTWRLPFMNLTPEQSQYRNDLRRAIASLRTNGTLHATYISQDNRRPADLENVLFYNLGASVFRDVAKDAIRFVRKNLPTPDGPDAIMFTPRHYVRYGSENPESWFGAAGQIAARAELFRENLGDLKDVAGLWQSFKSGVPCASVADNLNRSGFILRLLVSGPETLREINLAEVIKPLADAFMSALHHYRGVQLDAVVDRLSTRLKGSPETVRELLLQEKGALLGPRAVPHLFREGLQWSPADDLLVGGEIMWEASGSGLISVKGELVAV